MILQALMSCLCKSLLVMVARFLKHKQAQTVERLINSLLYSKYTRRYAAQEPLQRIYAAIPAVEAGRLHPLPVLTKTPCRHAQCFSSGSAVLHAALWIRRSAAAMQRSSLALARPPCG